MRKSSWRYSGGRSFAAVASLPTTNVTLLEDADLRAWLGERTIELLTPAELLERLV